MSWRRAVLGALIAVPLVWLLASGLGKDPRRISSPLPGRDAPAFELAVLHGTPTDGAIVPADPATGRPAAGEPVRLERHRGDVVVVNFFASWCLACRGEHAPLNRAAERYRDRGVHVYGIVYQDAPENALRWIRNMGGQSYPALLDDGSRTAIEYGLYGVPETFFIDARGRVAEKRIGPVNDAILEETIERLLAERDLVTDAEEGSAR